LRNFMIATKIVESDFNHEDSSDLVHGLDWFQTTPDLRSGRGNELLHYWANIGEIRRTRGIIEHQFNPGNRDVSDVTNRIMSFAGKAGKIY
jgi:hypothetical protein